jgi:hypothetical protein
MAGSEQQIQIGLHGTSQLSPAALMAAIVQDPLPNMFVKWYWVPAVSHVEAVRGSWNEEQAQRILHMADGKQMLETAVSVRPGEGFLYELTEFTNALGFFFTKIDDRWTFETDGQGGTIVHWTWILHTRPGRHLLGRLFASQWRKYMAVIFKQSIRRLSNS